jgi:hypothetical protein
MLSIEAIKSADALTQVLDGRRMYLMTKEGTPLDQLVKASRIGTDLIMTDAGGEKMIDSSTMAYLANAKDKTLGFSQHDQTMDEITTVCIQAVSEHMRFARTVVAPAIGDLVERTMTSLREMTPMSLLGMEVIPWCPPEPMVAPTFGALISRFDTVAFDSPAMTMRCPTITFTEMLELMHTGTKSLDNSIDNWVATKGEAFFNNIWMSVFQINSVPAGGRSKLFKDFTEDPECGMDNALAIFLMARKLIEAGPMQGVEMSKPAFERAAADFRNQAAARLRRGLDEMALVEKAGTLVRKHIQPNKVIVNDRVYRGWIEAGGDNEVLFGNMLQGTPNVTISQINAKSQLFKSAWQKHAALTASVESNKRFARIKQILSKHFEAQLKDLNDEEEATTANRMQIQKLFDELLSKVTEQDTEDLWSLCLRLVCRSRFYRTDAERILEGIERAKRKNPTLPVREAAAVSMIEYIGYWVANQFKPMGL